jgi:hypothetical protein
MAMLMITGGKIGSIIGRKRAFAIGLVIYCAGSLTTALSPNLPWLLFGWSLLEGIGAALIMPAIVALVARNFPPAGRPRAYGLVGPAGAIAIAVWPLIGGLATTYASWRLVFAGAAPCLTSASDLAGRWCSTREPPGTSLGVGMRVLGYEDRRRRSLEAQPSPSRHRSYPRQPNRSASRMPSMNMATDSIGGCGRSGPGRYFTSAPPNESRTSRLCTPNLRANARRSRPTATLVDPSVRWPGNR